MIFDQAAVDLIDQDATGDVIHHDATVEWSSTKQQERLRAITQQGA